MTKPRLKLFKIEVGRYTFMGKAVDDAVLYFDNKRVARHTRERLLDEGRTGIVVMRGPDHRRGESFNESEQMKSTKGKHQRPTSSRG